MSEIPLKTMGKNLKDFLTLSAPGVFLSDHTPRGTLNAPWVNPDKKMLLT